MLLKCCKFLFFFKKFQIQEQQFVGFTSNYFSTKYIISRINFRKFVALIYFGVENKQKYKNYLPPYESMFH